MKNLKETKSENQQGIEVANRYMLITEEVQTGLVFYIIEPSGQRHCLMFHRSNWYLKSVFKGGMTLGEIYRIKPGRKESEQAVLHSARHIARVAEEFIKFELSAYPSAA